MFSIVRGVRVRSPPRHPYYYPNTINTRQIWTPSNRVPIKVLSKMAGRAAVAVGGATVGTATYYAHKVNDWTERMRNDTRAAFDWFGRTLTGFVTAAAPSEEDSAVEGSEQEQIGGGDAQNRGDGEIEISSMANSIMRLLILMNSKLIFKVHHAQQQLDANIPGSTAANNFSGNQFMQELTRRMLEIKSILKTVSSGDQTSTGMLWLPSIVVIGSQSSGKSSLLESLVGQEFLPKGTNMVTRRPIEITLVHSPHSSQQYAEFPKQGLRQLTDFSRVQRIIAELNESVPASECVSDDPIDLRIYSPHVPDLTLIDLPGYIALHNRQQPPELKQKIVGLCRRYIQPENIILAVSAADVDLANSEALNESRAVDPDGRRTLGVLTKMDLVSPERGALLLRNQDFPLQLGYVGVICGTTIANASNDNASNNNASNNNNINIYNDNKDSKYRKQALAEERYFRLNATAYDAVLDRVGTTILRRTLMIVLERRLQESLQSIAERVRTELDDVRYQFKVQFNDRRITAEAYIAEVIDGLKQGIRQLSLQFSRTNLRQTVRERLDSQAMDICMQEYWMDDRLADAMSLVADNSSIPATTSTTTTSSTDSQQPSAMMWRHKLDAIHAAFTKSGVGKMTTQSVVEAVMQSIEEVVAAQPQLAAHPQTAKRILSLAGEIVRRKLFTTVDQVENTIKPLKYDIEINRTEWSDSLHRSLGVMNRELEETRRLIDETRRQIGKRKLRAAIQYLDAVDKLQQQQQSPLPPVQFSPLVLEKARKVRELQRKADRLSHRLAMIKPGWLYNSPCAAKFVVPSAAAAQSPTKGTSATVATAAAAAPAGQHYPAAQQERRQYSPPSTIEHNQQSARLGVCPEPFLLLLSDKLAQTAVMFIWFELLNEFFYLLPREIDNNLYYNLSHEQIVEFASENPTIKEHLRLQEKKDALELAMEKLQFAMQTQQR